MDFKARSGAQCIDWNTADIDFEGRGGDRGLRGIALHGDEVFIAASDELFCYDRNFVRRGGYRNRYLRHCHEICRKGGHVFLTSTGFDSLLAFNLGSRSFEWGFRLQRTYDEWGGYTFDPGSDSGPAAVNDFHLNMVHVDDAGIFFSGLRTGALLHLDSDWVVSEVCSLPEGIHNARPWRDGVLFNDTANDRVRFVRRNGAGDAFRIVSYDESQLLSNGVDDSNIARQAFARGLVPFGDRFLFVGSSPSTITLYDVEAKQMVASVNLSMDIRNAIHGLSIWSEPGTD